MLKIACDDYYRSDWSPHSRFGFDTVDAIDAEALLCELRDARSRGLSKLRTYDMRNRSVGARTLDSFYDLILLEGAYGPQLVLSSIPPDLLCPSSTVTLRHTLLRTCWTHGRNSYIWPLFKGIVLPPLSGWRHLRRI